MSYSGSLGIQIWIGNRHRPKRVSTEKIDFEGAASFRRKPIDRVGRDAVV